LEDALVRLSTVATDIFGISGRQIIEVFIASECDPEVLGKLARGRRRSERAAIWSNIGERCHLKIGHLP